MFPCSRSRSPRLASRVLAALVALGAGAAAVAAERATGADDQDAPRSSERADSGSDKVCRRVRPIGSNIPQTICKTRHQMADEQSAARNALDSNRVREY